MKFKTSVEVVCNPTPSFPPMEMAFSIGTVSLNSVELPRQEEEGKYFSEAGANGDIKC